MGMFGDWPNLDPHYTNGSDTLWNVWDRLEVYDNTLTLEASLADSFDFSSDARQLKLNLRRGANTRAAPRRSGRRRARRP